MPELPEVETIRIKLEKYIVGKTITEILAINPKSLFGNPILVEGKKISNVKRIGKMLVIATEGDMIIGIHLKMSGQLIITQNSKFKSQNHNSKFKINSSGNNYKHLRVQINFYSGDSLNFIDQRKFGWMKIMTNHELGSMKYVNTLGPEPWDVSDESFFATIKNKHRPIKLVILDQQIIAGIGNIYANDSLWEAGINPKKLAYTITKNESEKLKQSMIKILKEAIKYGGSTGNDKKYVHPNGMYGEYQNYFRVYERKDKPCLRGDGGIIKKIQVGGRGTYFCPVCQK